MDGLNFDGKDHTSTRTDTSVSDMCVDDFISHHALVSFKLEGVQKFSASARTLQR